MKNLTTLIANHNKAATVLVQLAMFSIMVSLAQTPLLHNPFVAAAAGIVAAVVMVKITRALPKRNTATN